MLSELAMLNCAQQGKVLVVPLALRVKLQVATEVRERVVSSPVELEKKGLRGEKVFFEWQEASDVERTLWKSYY